MIIRKYKESDLDRVLEIIGTFSLDNKELAEVEFPKYVAISGSQFYVCEINDIVVGVLGYIPDLEGAKNIYWAEWGYVHKDYRKKGIASKLWDTIENELKSKGCRRLFIDIGNESEHADAIRLYINRGYVKEAEIHDFWDVGEDFLIYSKQLA